MSTDVEIMRNPNDPKAQPDIKSSTNPLQSCIMSCSCFCSLRSGANRRRPNEFDEDPSAGFCYLTLAMGMSGRVSRATSGTNTYALGARWGITTTFESDEHFGRLLGIYLMSVTTLMFRYDNPVHPFICVRIPLTQICLKSHIRASVMV